LPHADAEWSVLAAQSCFAQAQGEHPGRPFDACFSPVDAADKTSCFVRPERQAGDLLGGVAGIVPDDVRSGNEF
jgi:hypothetical protein